MRLTDPRYRNQHKILCSFSKNSYKTFSNHIFHKHLNYSEQKANNFFLTISNKTKSKKAIHLSINQLNVQKHMLWILMFNQNMLFKTFIQRQILIFVFKINLRKHSKLYAFCKFCTTWSCKSKLMCLNVVIFYVVPNIFMNMLYCYNKWISIKKWLIFRRMYHVWTQMPLNII